MTTQPRGRRGHGEGSVYQRPNGTWVGLLDLGYVEGKRRRRTVNGRTRAEVVEKLGALRREQVRGVDLAARPRTVAEWLTEWLRDIKAHDGTRAATLARYESIMRQHLAPGLGRKRLDRLTPRDVQLFLASKAGTVAPRTVLKMHNVLRAALSDAERMELVSRNVAKAVRGPSVPHTERPVLMPADAARLLSSVSGDRFEAVFVLGLAMGLRRGEVLGLRWRDLDFAERSLSVRQTVQRVDGALRLVQPKTQRSRRALPMPDLAVRALERQRARQAVDRLAAGSAWHDQDLVFSTTVGTPLEPRNVNRRFERLRSDLDLPWLRLHDLRHACATFLLSNGVEPRVVMEILGHSTIRLTMDTYGHVLPDRLRAAAEAMDLAFGADGRSS